MSSVLQYGCSYSLSSSYLFAVGQMVIPKCQGCLLLMTSLGHGLFRSCPPDRHTICIRQVCVCWGVGGGVMGLQSFAIDILKALDFFHATNKYT